MALTKTVSELKEVLPKFIPNNISNTVLPNFNNSDAKYLVPLIGSAYYADLQTKYNAGTTSADEKDLLLKLRLISVAYAFRDEQAFGHLTLSESGIRKVQASQTAEVRKWEYEKLEEALTTLAADATETVLAWLYDKKPALWLSSAEYTEFSTLLIRSGSEFQKQYKLFQPLRTFYALRPVLQDAQTLYIGSGIGADLLAYLVALTVVPAGLTNAIRYLKKSLSYFAIAEACTAFSVRFSDAGFTVLSGTTNNDIADAGRNAADKQDLQDKQKASLTRGQDFLALAQVDLIKHYSAPGTDAAYKTALEKGSLNDFLTPKEFNTGNDRRKFFVL